MKRALIGGGLAAVAIAGFVLAGSGGNAPKSAKAASSVGDTARVERRDLVARDDVDGTLGYADAATLASGGQGVLTGLREPGTTITRGHSLYDLDGDPAAFLLYGALPAWRDLQPGITDREDIRQLERNLRALGYDPGDVDDDWDWETTAAVIRFQKARGLTQDGSLSRGEVVFGDGPARMGEAKATPGQTVNPGMPLASMSSTARRVTVELDARRQAIAREGDSVTVELPDGRTVKGRISDVGTVASKPTEESDSTIDVTIRLRAKGSKLDGAPVSVGFAVDRREDVLAVPVQRAARAPAAATASSRRDAPDRHGRAGRVADDWVEVKGDLGRGTTVVVAQ